MISLEFEILMLSVRLDDTNDAVSKAVKIISTNKIDWNDLLERARLHGIRPQLENLLNKVSSAEIPDYVMENLQDSIRENLLRQLNNIVEFFNINKSLEVLNIQIIPFKGFWLAHEMYGNLADRESFDVDLFIDLKDLEKIKSVMTEKGYIVQKTLTRLTEGYILNELSEYNFSKFSGDTRIFHFEYQWRIGLKSYRMDIKMKDIASQITKGVLQNQKFTVFTPEANLLLVIMHHGGKDRFIRLRDVLDISKIIRNHPDLDWSWLIEKAKKFHVENLVYLGVQLASKITGIPVPFTKEEKVKTVPIFRMADNRIYRMAMPVKKWDTFTDELLGWLFRIRSRDGWQTKVKLSAYAIRKILMPRLVRERWRYLFFNRKIIAKPVLSNGA